MAAAPDFSLDDFLQRRWDALANRLGERRGALLATIAEKAAQRGFAPGVNEARFANLCMAFGPGFETRPENEWALAILLDERLEAWTRLHQLVVQGAATLRRRGDDGDALAQRLLDNDQLVLDRFDTRPPTAGRLPRRHAVPRLRRTACDLEAVEVRLLDTAFRHEYRRQAEGWQRVTVEAPAPLRIDAQHLAPERVTVLAGLDGAPEAVRLQVRSVYHGRCGLDEHPAVETVGGQGRQQWRGQEARAPSWTVSVPAATWTGALLRPPWHDISLLRVTSCGLRDAGVPMGSLELPVWAHAARQSLFTFEREAALAVVWPDAKSDPPAVKATKVRVEHDGQAADAAPWVRGFDVELRQALADGLKKLGEAWQASVQDGTLRAEMNLLDGRAGMTWGLREGPRALASPPVLRVVADLDLAAKGQLELGGWIEYGGAKARLRLRFEGESRLQALIERLHGDAELLALMEGAVLRWRWPAQIEFDALADESAVSVGEVGPVSGAITGSLGLRPHLTDGGSWQWFVQLALEPVATRIVVHDPVLGRSEHHLGLLGSVAVMDWSLG